MSLDRDDTAGDETPFDLQTAPLEEPPFGEHDWGGDGSDLDRPVRAHVLAALVANSEPYPPPLDALLRLGDPRDAGIQKRRHALGIGLEHAPQLARMARDRALFTADGDTLEVWAPVHAVEILSELDTSALVDDLVPLLDLGEEWFDEPLPDVFVRAGQAAFEPLRRYLLDASRSTYGRSNAGAALVELAKQHPELQDSVVAALRAALTAAEHNTELGNGLLVARVLDLKAVQALPEIRHAFSIDRVDEMVAGDWATVQRELGAEPDPDDPLTAESARRWDERRERMFPRDLVEKLDALLGGSPIEALPAEAPLEAQQKWAAPRASKAGQQAKKAKHKRKTATASRKANRKKRK